MKAQYPWLLTAAFALWAVGVTLNAKYERDSFEQQRALFVAHRADMRATVEEADAVFQEYDRRLVASYKENTELLEQIDALTATNGKLRSTIATLSHELADANDTGRPLPVFGRK